MKKVLSSILITVIMLANFLAPVSVGWNEKNIPVVKKNYIEAADFNSDNTKEGYLSAFNSSILKQTSSTYINENSSDIGLTITIDTGVADGGYSLPQWIHLKRDFPTINVGFSTNYGKFKESNLFVLKIKETDTGKTGIFDLTNRFKTEYTAENIDIDKTATPTSILKTATITQLQPLGNTGLSLLKPGKTYDVGLFYASSSVSNPLDGGTYIEGLDDDYYYEMTTIQVTTATEEQLVTGTLEVDDAKTNQGSNPESSMPACGIDGLSASGGTIKGCLAQGIYYVIFMPSSVLFALAGTFFDNTFAYSVNDASYRSTFVVEGWNIVRDFCNMFFIFILLYIAFGTILNISGVKTKEMIINVVIIGLLINFSLFATRVIIDASNILARVFYNSDTIKITALDKDGGGNEVTDTIAKMNASNVLPLSSALVNKVNPQALIINAGKMGDIPDKAGQSDQTKKAGGVTTGTFIFVTLLASGINIVGFIVFLTVGLIFVVRVVGLWLAMILVPFAFFSYTVPAMQDWGMVGWKKWWPETLKMAFLAPVFVFFLYLILKFLEKGLGIIDVQNKVGLLDSAVAIVIPFAFIMVLLMKAKDIAVKMSGDMGAAVSKVGAMAGGLALGAATGGAAMAMRGTLGRAGSVIANSDRVKGWEKKGYFGAATLRNIGKSAEKGSFDVKGSKFGALAGKGLGVDMGKAKEGGFGKIKEEKIEKRVKRAKELEKSEGSEDKRKASGLEAQIRTSKAGKATDLARVEREITELRQKMQDQKTAGLEAEAAITYAQLEGKQDDKKILRGAEVKNAAGIVIVPKVVGGIADLEAQLNDLNDKINDAEIKSMNEYAKNMESMGNKTLNYVKTFGQHSGVGANIAADRIRKGVKIENTAK